ncbi:Hypothetical predicted protein [Lecanosticta acicola]|uniref:Uncharacterized protein n=1 Tax=Lecanosticta acicola TaxID=111012 RepID=A0AAI9E8M3_9PEZI|nr:Hypothetical predicted protein [Lecanosticta acicola]
MEGDKPVYINAQNLKRHCTYAQPRSTIRKLAAGYKKAGSQKEDAVCLHNFNDINYPIVVNGFVAFAGISWYLLWYESFLPTMRAVTCYQSREHQISLLMIESEILKQADDAGIPGGSILIFDNRESTAYIVKQDNEEGKKLDAKAVMEYLASRLARFKRPDGGVVFLDEIPKIPYGKISDRGLA